MVCLDALPLDGKSRVEWCGKDIIEHGMKYLDLGIKSPGRSYNDPCISFLSTLLSGLSTSGYRLLQPTVVPAAAQKSVFPSTISNSHMSRSN